MLSCRGHRLRQFDDGGGAFRRVIPVVELVGIPYMLTGSFASSFHGVPRATQDIDLVIAPTAEQLHGLVRSFASPAYYIDETAAVEAQP